MSFVDCVAFGIKSRKTKYLFVNLKDTKYIMDLDSEDKMLLNRIIQQYLNRISARAAANLIQTAVNCTAAFNIHFTAIL